MILILYQHHDLYAALLCDSRTKPIWLILQKIPSWKLMSKGERAKKGERRPQMLGVQEERSHMSLRGERHVYVMLMLMICFALILFPYVLPLSNTRFRGSKTPKEKKSVKFIAYLYSWGHVEFNVVPCTHSLHVIPVLVFLWFLLFALASGCTCVI